MQGEQQELAFVIARYKSEDIIEYVLQWFLFGKPQQRPARWSFGGRLRALLNALQGASALYNIHG